MGSVALECGLSKNEETGKSEIQTYINFHDSSGERKFSQIVMRLKTVKVTKKSSKTLLGTTKPDYSVEFKFYEDLEEYEGKLTFTNESTATEFRNELTQFGTLLKVLGKEI